MVCIPCIVIPALLWVYYRFLRPFMGPVFDKLGQWLEPFKHKFLEYTGGAKCPVGAGRKEGLIKTKTASAPPDEEDEGIDIDSEEKLNRAMESGAFGANIADLRKRQTLPSAPVELGSGDQ